MIHYQDGIVGTSISMPICKHMVPVKFSCARCDKENLEDRVKALEDRFATIDHLIRASNTAESLFAQKVHELKSIDQKRDDVINALCQQMAQLTDRVIDKYPHPLLGQAEKLLGKI